MAMAYSLDTLEFIEFDQNINEIKLGGNFKLRKSINRSDLRCFTIINEVLYY